MGPEDQHPWDREDEEIRKAFMAKDAEIQRLKADFQKAKEWNQLCEMQIRNLQEIVASQDKLITELGDALEAKTSCVEYDDIALIQRGREAAK